MLRLPGWRHGAEVRTVSIFRIFRLTNGLGYASLGFVANTARTRFAARRRELSPRVQTEIFVALPRETLAVKLSVPATNGRTKTKSGD
jgi:hypothetical protein